MDDAAGFDTSAIRSADALSVQRISLAQKELARHAGKQCDLIACGSLARHEATAGSDFDYLAIVSALPDDMEIPQSLLKEADDLRAKFAYSEGLPDEVRGPGSSGIFGSAIGVFDLINNIGLQADTNRTLTHRMMLLSESVSLCDKNVYDKVARACLSRYLSLSRMSLNDPTPRFLLNDVLRYWRTITVDYQAKADLASGRDWALRYLKLKIPRKLSFTGSLICLLRCDATQPGVVDDLLDKFESPPLGRLIWDAESASPEARHILREIIRIANEWLLWGQDVDWRADIRNLDRASCLRSRPFRDAHRRANDLHCHLQKLFFDCDYVDSSRAKKYLLL